MSRLVWDVEAERTYETGVEAGVLYPFKSGSYQKGVVWNGLTAVNESPSGAEPTKIYADNIPYLTLTSLEEFGATIEAYTYPDEFEECDGSKELAPGITIGQQERIAFGFAYKTKKGNAAEGDTYGYKIKLVYGCKATPSEKSHNTINDSPEASSMSWTISTTPVVFELDGKKYTTATLDVDSTKVSADTMKKIEDALYGTDGEGSGQGTDARLLTPVELMALIKEDQSSSVG